MSAHPSRLASLWRMCLFVSSCLNATRSSPSTVQIPPACGPDSGRFNCRSGARASSARSNSILPRLSCLARSRRFTSVSDSSASYTAILTRCWRSKLNEGTRMACTNCGSARAMKRHYAGHLTCDTISLCSMRAAPLAIGRIRHQACSAWRAARVRRRFATCPCVRSVQALTMIVVDHLCAAKFTPHA